MTLAELRRKMPPPLDTSLLDSSESSAQSVESRMAVSRIGQVFQEAYYAVGKFQQYKYLRDSGYTHETAMRALALPYVCGLSS